MLIIGCDFHPGLQQVTIFDNQSGEYQEKRLGHREEAERFYGLLSGPVRDGSVRANGRKDTLSLASVPR